MGSTLAMFLRAAELPFLDDAHNGIARLGARRLVQFGEYVQRASPSRPRASERRPLVLRIALP
jgi:hypothetical protein